MPTHSPGNTLGNTATGSPAVAYHRLRSLVQLARG